MLLLHKPFLTLQRCLKARNCESRAESTKRHLGGSGTIRTLFLTSKTIMGAFVSNNRNKSCLCSSAERRGRGSGGAAAGKQPREECCLLLWLLQQSRDLHPSVGYSGSGKSPLLQGFKRQLDKSVEEISTEAIKSKVFLLVTESPASLIAGWENCYCVFPHFFWLLVLQTGG